MAVMPGVNFTDAARGSLMSRWDVVCVHTIVGHPPANAAHFSTAASGYIWQSRDTRYRSAANYNGNHRVIAIENEDMGSAYGAWNTADGHQVPGFTAQQVEAIAQICAWAHRTHGIPLVLCPDSRPTSRGIAFHRQGIDGNWSGYAYSGRVSGGEVWTTAPGKVCPGDRRITQLISQIIPRARQVAGLDPAVRTLAPVEDENMQLIKGDKADAVFVVYWNQPGAIAVRKRVPNPNDPGYQAAVAAGYQVKTVAQAVIDAIPDAVDRPVMSQPVDLAPVIAFLAANPPVASVTPTVVDDIANASAVATVAELKKEGN